MIRRAAVVLVVLLVSLDTSYATEQNDDRKTVDRVTFEIPLDDGRIHIGHLLDRASHEAGVDPGTAFGSLDWTVDVNGMAGRARLMIVERISGGAVRLRPDENKVVVTIDAKALQQRSEQLQRAAQLWFTDRLGSAQRPAPRHLGITFVTDADPHAQLTALEAFPNHIVLLIHGLDDPGWMWRDMIPALLNDGYAVARFEYRNDGPISDTADELAAQLRVLKSAGVQRIDIVSHSMGGLVSRDVLTRQSIYAGDGAGTDELPSVDRLIMLGPPNHGSQIVRLRAVAELKEHLYRMFSSGQFDPDWTSDGDGEAAIDLLPGSDYLRRLNARPQAKHTRCTIVAGRMSPVSAKQVQVFTDQVRLIAGSSAAPKWLRDLMQDAPTDKAMRVFSEAVRGIGDGCVSIDSARLDGVEDYTIVEADHVSLIVNVLSSDRVPPSIPIVLERLSTELVQP